jgi:hypothetical protein
MEGVTPLKDVLGPISAEPRIKFVPSKKLIPAAFQ